MTGTEPFDDGLIRDIRFQGQRFGLRRPEAAELVRILDNRGEQTLSRTLDESLLPDPSAHDGKALLFDLGGEDAAAVRHALETEKQEARLLPAAVLEDLLIALQAAPS